MKETNKKELKFEDAIKKLEEIAKKLESEDLELDESVSQFEEGMRLSKICTKMLDEAEKRINILIDKDGEISEESFTPEE